MYKGTTQLKESNGAKLSDWVHTPVSSCLWVTWDCQLEKKTHTLCWTPIFCNLGGFYSGSYLSFFPVPVINSSEKKNCKEGRFGFSSQLRGLAHHGGGGSPRRTEWSSLGHCTHSQEAWNSRALANCPHFWQSGSSPRKPILSLHNGLSDISGEP